MQARDWNAVVMHVLLSTFRREHASGGSNKGVQEEVVFVALLHGTVWFSVNRVSSFFALITIVKNQLSSRCCVCTQVLLCAPT